MSPSPTATGTVIPSPLPTSSPSGTPTAIRSATATHTGTPRYTATPPPTSSSQPSATPQISVTPTPSLVPPTNSRTPVLAPCAGDLDGDDVVTIAELIQAVGSALHGCSTR